MIKLTIPERLTNIPHLTRLLRSVVGEGYDIHTTRPKIVSAALKAFKKVTIIQGVIYDYQFKSHIVLNDGEAESLLEDLDMKDINYIEVKVNLAKTINRYHYSKSIRFARDYVYIGRPSMFGNPFTVKEHGKGVAVELFSNYFDTRIKEDADFKLKVEELKGKRLGCTCNSNCHGDVIAAYVNQLDQ